jgi:hypothetical protein
MLHQQTLRKFEEVKEVNGEISIETPKGFIPVKRIMKTIPYQKWYLVLEDGYTLEAADNHIVFDGSNNEVFMKDIKPDDIISTIDGPKICLQCFTKDEYENMYDVELEHGHIYYSNGITSHNTTSVSIVLLWYAMFNHDKCCAVLANIDRTAMSILGDIKTIYENLPLWLKPGCREWNAHTINFDNGSKIFAAATSKNGIAGESISFLYVDEMALIEAHVADEFWKANYPTVQHGEKIVVTSTPRGVGNLFYNIWRESKEGTNGFTPIRIDYWEFEGYRSPEWKEEQIKNLGQIGFNSEYGNQFIGSSNTLVTAEALQKMKENAFLEESQIHGGYQRWFEYFDKNSLDPRNKIFYVAAADIGMGSGNDYSTLQIFKGTWREPNEQDILEYESREDEPPEAIVTSLKQAYTFRSNLINIPDFTKFVFETLPEWGNPYFIFESNGIGQSFSDKMNESYPYENVYVHFQNGMSAFSFGINSNVATKTKAINSLKKFVEGDILKIIDRELINEFLTFVEKKSSSGNRRFSAEDGSNDDLIIGCAWVCFLLETLWFKDCLTFIV